MGRHTVASWRGIALPGAIGWVLNRRRYLSTLPSLERKLRILIDWALDFVFNNDTAGLLDYDYQLDRTDDLRSVGTDQQAGAVNAQINNEEDQHFPRNWAA